ncbi:hypothetical protein Aduo_014822 [Ancylostoma duodenale]
MVEGDDFLADPAELSHTCTFVLRVEDKANCMSYEVAVASTVTNILEYEYFFGVPARATTRYVNKRQQVRNKFTMHGFGSRRSEFNKAVLGDKPRSQLDDVHDNLRS